MHKALAVRVRIWIQVSGSCVNAAGRETETILMLETSQLPRAIEVLDPGGEPVAITLLNQHNS